MIEFTYAAVCVNIIALTKFPALVPLIAGRSRPYVESAYYFSRYHREHTKYL
jgi:hypothetical protein